MISTVKTIKATGIISSVIIILNYLEVGILSTILIENTWL